MLFFFGSCSFLCVLFIFVYRLFRKPKAVEEKLMSDNKAPEIKYDVFVSFRGEIRRRFLSHLVGAFKRNNIRAFVDDRLQRGHEIEPSLVKAIEGSFISLIIFSLDYASSRWCLDELVKIHECKEKYGRIVIPVFYYVEPTHVRHQSSDIYKIAFAGHEKKYTTKVKSWRDAMKKSATLSGLESSKFGNDEELIEEIVNLINGKLKELATPVNSKRLIAIKEKVATVVSLIRKMPENTHVIGIWGMGGIGKTTLAEEVFNKLQFDYDGSYFLADERVQSKKHGIDSLKKNIFSELLGCDVDIETPNSLPDHIVRKAKHTKVLIVLDDVDDPEHLGQILGYNLDFFGSGSRIIITTRNEQVLKTSNANETYNLTELSFDEALDLFNLHAFNQGDDQREYNDLSKRVVHYAKGIPLVLEVLAHDLRGNTKELWEGELDKLEKKPPKKVYDVMIRSYSNLEPKQQEIFLDLACFFLRLHHTINVTDLKFLLKDDQSGNSVVSDLERLKQKALITLSEDNCVSMHDVLQEMALKIARGEPIRDPGSRNRLWDPKDISEVLKTGKVSEDVRSIQIDFSKIKELKSIPDDIFAKMSRLQFLEISGMYVYKQTTHCILAERLQSLPSELRFLHWYDYPLQSLPETFSVEKLVILSLHCGKMEKLWDGVKNLVNLKVVDVSESRELKKLPDLSKATNLEVLNAWLCDSLLTIGKLPCSLKTLNVRGCTSLQTLLELPPRLETLDASFCKSLHTIGKLPPSLETLNVGYCYSLQTLPELSLSLETLDVTLCTSLHTIGNLPHCLKTVRVDHCTSLQTLPEPPPLLETLNVKWCESLHTIEKLPQRLKTLSVYHSTSLQTLPELPPLLETLDAGVCESLRTIGRLPHSLKTLKVDNCTSLQTLPELPPYLENLDVSDCESLQTIGELPYSLKTLNVCSCTSLQTLPELPPLLETLRAGFFKSFHTIGKLPDHIKTLWVPAVTSLQTLPKLPPLLETLEATECTSLRTIGNLPLSLKTLHVGGCTSLQTLPELPPSLETLHASGCKSLLTIGKLPHSLKTLNVWSCTSLQTLPKLPPSLETLHAGECRSLQTLPELPPLLETLHAGKCESLHTIGNLPPSLKTLDVYSCTSLQTLPELPPSLETLDATGCKSLHTIEKLPHSLKTPAHHFRLNRRFPRYLKF